MVEDDEYIYLDSFASKRLFILRDQSYLESFVYSVKVIKHNNENGTFLPFVKDEKILKTLL